MLGFLPLSDTPLSSLLGAVLPPVPVPVFGFTMPRIIFDSRSPSSTRTEEFNFLGYLTAGETINSAVVGVIVFSGTDASPNALLSGAPAISGSSVRQKFSGGVPGVIYGAVCSATTSHGQVLQLGAFIAVLADP
jgi:hypothetical protein